MPLDFPEKWLEILDSFYGQRASINPPCMIESVEVPNAGNVIADVEDEGAGEIPPIDSYRGATSQAERPQMSHNDCGVRHNTSKRKKNTSMFATAIVDVMGHFTSSFVATKERRHDHEEKKIKWMEEQSQNSHQWQEEIEARFLLAD
ncbi:hypothetical protein R1flu_021701 [Riccia fluitans]|uniref:Uncharacterized protein n=1 Tax=Riccia fluitans TaxID=41844 RepID=A0ABD1ZQ60_9MARC